MSDRVCITGGVAPVEVVIPPPVDNREHARRLRARLAALDGPEGSTQQVGLSARDVGILVVALELFDQRYDEVARIRRNLEILRGTVK